jgi:WD40 repeat protein
MNKTAVVTIVFVALFLAIPFRAAAQNSSATQEPIQAGHTHDVIEVKWSPDDERLISYSGGDGYIRLWEVKSARLMWGVRTNFIQQKGEYYRLTNFAWNPDQSLIASGSENGMIQVWDAQTGKLRWNVRAHDEHVNTVSFSQDGKYLVSSGLDENEKNEIKTWSVVNGSSIKKFNADPGAVIAVSVNADGTEVKTGNLGGEVSEWNSATGALVRKRKINPCGGAGSRARRVAFSADLNLMSARCAEQTVITDTASGKVVRRVKMEVDFTETMAFSGNGKVLSANDSGHSKVINLNDGEIREVDEFHIGQTIDLWRRDGEFSGGHTQFPDLIYNHRFSVLDLEFCSLNIRWSGRKKQVFFAFFERRRSRSIFGNLLNKTVRDYAIFDFSRVLGPVSFLFNLPDPGLIRIYIGFSRHWIFYDSNEIHRVISLNCKSRRDFVVNRDFIRMFFTSDKNKTHKQKC